MTKNLSGKALATIGLLVAVNATSQPTKLDISGDWIISSSVGGKTPITVNCSLIQKDAVLTGSCTPVMENPEPSPLTGAITGSAARWGYDVVFKGNHNHVDFNADKVSSMAISGMLSLGPTPAPFTAVRK